ncbi:MAG TPA: zonular occludens toxin domain-containing protein [Terriglobales bacterium]|nr:zonular occludens toxin domain-containing protein [Terriglobales bacterium]
MILIVEGKGVGAGKSYFGVDYCLRHWCIGGTVFASQSLHFDWEEIKKYVAKAYGWLLHDEQYHPVAAGDIWKLHEVTPPGTDECPVLIMIDEAQDQLNARDFADKNKRDLFSWCCQSRHDDNDLVFITQNALNIDKQIRRLATFYYSIRNLSNFPIAGLGKIGTLAKVFSFGLHNGTIFMRAQIDNNGKTVLERKFVSANPAIWKCYKSKSMKLSRKRLGAPIARKQLQRRTEHKPMTKFILIAAVILLSFGAYRVWKHGFFPKAAIPIPIVAPVGAPAKTPTPIPQKTADGAYDIKTSRLVAMGNGDGWMQLESGTYYVGRMSADGYCDALRDRVARVRQPNGRLLFVVADDAAATTHSPPPQTHEAPQQSATPGPIIVAKMPSLFRDRDTAPSK